MIKELSILKSYILYILTFILVCMIGITGVFADTYENIGYLDDYSDVTVEVSYTSSPLPLNRTNTYQLDQVEAINIFVNNFSFLAGTTYSLEFFTPHTTLDYANAFTVVGNGSNNQPVSCNTVGITYTDIKYLNFKFNCSSTVNSISLRIYNSSNNYIMDTGIFAWNYVYLRKVTSSTDTSVLESQTAQIIQGQQDIINNQNANTEKQIESQKVCKDYNINKDNTPLTPGILTSNGSINNISGYFHTTDYIDISNSTNIKINNTRSNPASYCLYNSNKSLINCIPYNNQSVVNVSITSDVNYIRFTLYTVSYPTYLTYNQCKNGNQAVSDSVNNLNDSINDSDSSGATNEASEFFNSFTTNTFGLTSIITAPLNLIQSLTSSTCTQLHLPLPYLDNKYLDLPCMSSIYSQYFGNFFTIYQTITYGIIAYWICVRIFNQVKDFKNPEHDEIEVVDL